MEDTPKVTVGAAALELMQKEPEINTVVDQQQAMQENYLAELATCVSDFSSANPNQDFFVVVMTKNEKLMPNVFRNYFCPRFSCPTPNYDQAVYHYRHGSGNLEFVWAIPCKEACLYLKDNALQVAPDERDLLNFVLAFADGTLYNLCRYLNKEIEAAPQITS